MGTVDRVGSQLVTGSPAGGSSGTPSDRHDAGSGNPSMRMRTAGLVGAWLVLVAIGVIVGTLLGDSTGVDRSVSEWFVGERTGELNVVSRLFSLAGDTYTVIGIASFVVVVGLVRHERSGLVVLVAGLVGEVTIFLTITALVDRARPDVERLDGAPPTSSFPSGHTFAAIVLWGALAVVVTRSRWSPWLRSVFLTMMVVMPIAIGTSRLYRGMHHITDVLASGVLGTLWLVIVLKIFPGHPGHPRHGAHPEAVAADSRGLDASDAR